MDQVANHLRNGNSELSPGTLEETMAVNNRLLFSQITWSQMATCAPWITRWHSTTPTGCNSSNEPPWLIPTTLTHTLSSYWAQQKRWFNTRRAQRRNAGKLLWQYHKEILYEPISLQVLMFAGFNFTESIGPTHETARIQQITYFGPQHEAALKQTTAVSATSHGGQRDGLCFGIWYYWVLYRQW